MTGEIDPELRRRLVAVAGEGAVDDRGLVAPGSTAGVAAVVSVCWETSTPITVGSGAAAADRPGVRLSLGRLTAISVEVGNGVLWTQAGATVDSVRSAAGREGQAITGLPAATEAAHIGSLVARGEVPRRTLTGLELVLGTGEAVTWGGRMLKDVTGYDIPALILGSGGRLAIVVAAGLRLQPARAAPAGHASGAGPLRGGHGLEAAFDPRGLLRNRS